MHVAFFPTWPLLGFSEAGVDGERRAPCYSIAATRTLLATTIAPCYTRDMNRYRQLVAIAADRHGLVTSAAAAAEGVPRVLLVQMARRGVLEKVARGVYRVPELAGDPLAQYQEALLMLPGAVLSHETALDLHDLCDVNPSLVHVTVVPGTRLRKALPEWLAVHHGPLEPEDVTGHEGLAIVTPARAIVDGITTALGDRFIDQAIGAARERNLLTTREEQGVELARAMERARQLQEALTR